MRLIPFNFTDVFLLIHIIRTYLCTTTVKYYHLESPATRVMSEGFMSYSGVSSSTRCFARCAEHINCYYVSYDELQGRCILSEWDDGGSISAAGWSLFRLDPLGPDVGDYFTVGDYSFALSSQPMTKPEAENACASFGFGRLVEIRTTQMYDAIYSYLTSLPSDEQALYGNLWVASEWDAVANTYVFSDGSSLALTASNTNDASGYPDCMLMRQNRQYKFDDKFCTDQYSYMCERIY